MPHTLDHQCNEKLRDAQLAFYLTHAVPNDGRLTAFWTGTNPQGSRRPLQPLVAGCACQPGRAHQSGGLRHCQPAAIYQWHFTGTGARL